MNKISLYDISTELVNLLDGIEDQNGELTELDESQLEQLQEMVTSKTKNCIDYLSHIDMNIKMAKTEKDRLDAYIKTAKNREDNFKKYIIICMNKLNVTKLESDLYKLSIPKVRKIVSITDEEKLPPIYKTVQHLVKVDKKAIAKDLKDGAVEGATLIDSPNVSLKIGLK